MGQKHTAHASTTFVVVAHAYTHTHTHKNARAHTHAHTHTTHTHTHIAHSLADVSRPGRASGRLSPARAYLPLANPPLPSALCSAPMRPDNEFRKGGQFRIVGVPPPLRSSVSNVLESRMFASNFCRYKCTYIYASTHTQTHSNRVLLRMCASCNTSNGRFCSRWSAACRKKK